MQPAMLQLSSADARLHMRMAVLDMFHKAVCMHAASVEDAYVECCNNGTNACSTGAVLDGRDVGTVVLPHAQAKLFVTADATVRAQRRLAELQRRGLDASYDAVLADLRERDARDSSRAAAPMKAADDAEVLDTSDLDAAQAHAAALAFVRQRLEAWRQGHGQAAADVRVGESVGVGSAV